MRPFSYIKVKNAENACKESAASPAGAYIAGGTTLLDLMKIDILRPSCLIDINRLEDTGVRQVGDSVIIGALTSNSDLARDPLIEQHYPLLSQSILAGATAQLRNMATVGGNLMQKTRCYYYRNSSMPCNKREPGSGCPAIEGYNRIHAVLGGSSKCVAVNPSDMCVALVALDAKIHLASTSGTRTVAIDKFYLQPGEHPEMETALQPGELITAVELPLVAETPQSLYLKVRDRSSFAFALVSAAVALSVYGNRVKTARIAMGGVATVPWRATEAELLLNGSEVSKESFKAAAEAAMAKAHPLKHNKFKIELAKRTLVRALCRASNLA